MLAAYTALLQAIDITLLVAGCVVVIAAGRYLVRSGRWRDPLAGVPLAERGPTLVHLVGMFVAFVVLQQLALAAVFGLSLPDDPPEPGSVAWHKHQVAALLSHAASILVMVGVLWHTRPGRRRGPGAGMGLLIGLVAVLALLPIMTLQLHAGHVLWNWLNPEAPPPTHVVLRALNKSEWGPWGVGQLLISAILAAPLAEELFFRGILLGACVQHLRRAWPAIILSGVGFGLVHVVQPQDVLPLTTMGIVLGYVRLRWGSLWPCVAGHMLFNARTMLFTLLAPEFAEPI